MCNPVDPSKGLFQLLPKEITAEILHHVEINDLKTCARVSKYFKGLTEDKTVLQKHPDYQHYIYDVVAEKISALLCRDEKFFSALTKVYEDNSFARGIVTGNAISHMFYKGKTFLDDTELETLKTQILTSSQKFGHLQNIMTSRGKPSL